MLRVKILVNGSEIVNRHIRRVDNFKGENEVHSYLTDDGRTIEHLYSDGAEKLAIKLLEKNNDE